jgi:hypothetical protein
VGVGGGRAGVGGGRTGVGGGRTGVGGGRAGPVLDVGESAGTVRDKGFWMWSRQEWAGM